MNAKALAALQDYRAKVRAGLLPKPQRKPEVTRRLNVQLPRSYGPDSEKRIVLTVHPDGRLDLRPEHTRHTETVHVLDVYRFAIQCRANHAAMERAREAKARKATRLAAQRQARAERMLTRHVGRTHE